MISPAEILAQHLIDQSIFTDPSAASDWPLYVSSMPDSDAVEADVGTLYDTVGLLDGRIMDGGEKINHYGIQLRIRCIEYNEGWEKAWEVIEEFASVHNNNVVIDSVTYIIQNITQSSSIISLGAGETETTTKRREILTVNFLATIKES